MRTCKMNLMICAVLLLLSAGCGRSGNDHNPHRPPASPSSGPSAPSAPTETAVPSSPSAVPSAPGSSTPADLPGIDPALESRIARTMENMSLEEKIGQMLITSFSGTRMTRKTRQLIETKHIGGFILFSANLKDGLQPSVALLNELKTANRNQPVPLFLSVDQEGGRVSRLPDAFRKMPPAQTVGQTHDPRLAEQMGVLIAHQLQALGFNMNFAPVLDVASNPDNKVIGNRSFDANPELVAAMGTAMMDGLRSGGIIPVIKHFPGHGDTSADSHVELPVLHKTADQLAQQELLPFRHAIQSGAEAVMVAHILFPAIDPDSPSSLSKAMINGLLRDKLGFEGVVITDDLAMGAIARHYGMAEAALRAIEAGGDLVLISDAKAVGEIHARLLNEVHRGQLSEDRIDESVKRILRLKFTYDLQDATVEVPELDDLGNAEVNQWLQELSDAGNHRKRCCTFP